MNARSQTFDLVVEGKQVDEAVASIFHTILFHRSFGNFKFRPDGSYQISTLGYEDIDCDFLDLTYVCCASKSLDRTLKKEISGFSEALREANGPSSGQISLEFFQKKRNMFWATEFIPWEIWNLKLQIIKMTNEYDKLAYRERLGEIIAEKLFFIAEVMNKDECVPKMPAEPDLDIVFDTSYPDVTPYLFKLSYATAPGSNMGITMKKLLRETLSL